jgi:hypothetical protein
MAIHANCAGMTRRDSLKLGLGGMMGAGFVDLLRARGAAAGGGPAATAKAKSCILIWLDGGPTHYETFDPKPLAPSEVRGEFRPIPTNVPGIDVCEAVPELARIADKYALIRSVCHEQGNHGAGNHYMMTGAPTRIPVGCGAFVSFHPSMGAFTAYERGHQNGLPAYFSMPSITRSGGPNYLGAQYAPFEVDGDPNSAHFKVRDVQLPRGLENARFAGRKELRQQVDTLKRFVDKASGDPVQSLDQYYEQGYGLVSSAVAQKAFDIHGEAPQLRDKYGRNSFGQRALLSRRLVEAGVPFITLNEGGWDHHGDLFNAFRTRMPAFERTIAALIDDLDQRGLLESTLVCVLGEFGRTPKINKDAGRDHWSNAMSILMAGAGIRGGQVIGATDRQGYAAMERVLSPEHFVSTVYRKLGFDPNKIYYTPEGRPSHMVSNGTPISELM